ncbi:hypothetical protein NLJ89_g5674 [Agrocybe chaxingu]|uniref:Uncharacterized protein n=1 Tax=Agrocybe chaxingu TaxID=84603 RepID=A0A9W8MX42_9AGAR|nr:hypothetical protein NLJ89_g5674 [Agrocybe chaxingu]
MASPSYSSSGGDTLLSPEPISLGPAASPLHPSTIFDVEGLVVVITGGGTGIGLMMATALETNGATVYIVGRRMDVLEKAAKENSVSTGLLCLAHTIRNFFEITPLPDRAFSFVH